MKYQKRLLAIKISTLSIIIAKILILLLNIRLKLFTTYYLQKNK